MIVALSLTLCLGSQLTETSRAMLQKLCAKYDNLSNLDKVGATMQKVLLSSSQEPEHTSSTSLSLPLFVFPSVDNPLMSVRVFGALTTDPASAGADAGQHRSGSRELRKARADRSASR